MDSLVNYNHTATLEQKEEMAVSLQIRSRNTPIVQSVSGTGLINHLKCPFGCVDIFDTKVELYGHINSAHDDLNESAAKGNPEPDIIRQKNSHSKNSTQRKILSDIGNKF